MRFVEQVTLCPQVSGEGFDWLAKVRVGFQPTERALLFPFSPCPFGMFVVGAFL